MKEMKRETDIFSKKKKKKENVSLEGTFWLLRVNSMSINEISQKSWFLSIMLETNSTSLPSPSLSTEATLHGGSESGPLLQIRLSS